MRAISIVDRLEFDFIGNVVRKGLTLGDIDNDGCNELIVGGENGEVAIFKGPDKWLTISGLNFVSCVAVGDILNIKKNNLVITTADGWCHIYECITQSCLNDNSESQSEEKQEESTDQVDGQIFSSESVESEKSTSSDSCANSTQERNKTVLKRIHLQRIPANSKDILLADINGDGLIEMVLGLTDRVVRSYRWLDNNSSSNIQQTEEVLGNISGELIGLHKWECAKQIGSVTLHDSKDGTSSLLVSQPGGTFMRIICQPEHDTPSSSEVTTEYLDSGSTRTEHLLGSKIDYQFLGIYRMRNQNISTEILGNLQKRRNENTSNSSTDSSSDILSVNDANENRKNDKSGGKPYALATLDGTIMLVQDEIILWAIAVDHQIFALTKLDVTGNGNDDIIACSWDGHTYILDQNKNSVRFQLDDSVQAFECGYYNISVDAPPVTCFVYVTFRNKIYLYYDIPLKEMICNKFEPDLPKLNEILTEKELNKKSKKQLVEYLLYGA